ncbi:4Fe-4S ferredoxin, partial [Candidatus Aerophobetes bacterium]|nr:4Fe-4S ferredoxin [Candidatus Aerophobetes bacterium]
MEKLKKEKLKDFVDFLLKEYDVFAPFCEDGIFSFKKVENFYGINLGYKNSKKPPKEIFFPQEEVMFEYKKREVKSTEKVERERILLGIRPCDVKAISLLDNVFAGKEYEDVYYVNKRKNTIVVGFACNNPSSTCFCTLCGSGPFSKEGLDVFIVDIGESFLLEPLSSKG